jgi:peroxiredoxin
VLAIVNPPDDPGKVANFITQAKVTYPILFDCGQAAYSYILPDAMHRGEVTTPHVYLIDSNGIIRGDWVYGPQTTEVFQGRGLYTAIDKLLAARTH